MASALSMITSANVDISNCDREQIQFAGAILPHGVLVTASEAELRILQASSNCLAMVWIAAEKLLGQPLGALLSADAMENLRKEVARGSMTVVGHIGRCVLNGSEFDVLAHRSDGVLVIELERRALNKSGETEQANNNELYSEVRGTLARLSDAPSLQTFLDLTVTQVRAFTGFDRVLAYKFMADGSGWVCAESLCEGDGYAPYLGQHFPASDIPLPARMLFAKSWLRHQPDIGYRAVPIIPAVNPETRQPLDMSRALLRSVSVMYSDYLKNMGTQASMVMTLMKDGQLWGLIACHHHRSPRHIAYEVRTACELMAHMVSLLLSGKEDLEAREYSLRLKATEGKWLKMLARAGEFRHGLMGLSPLQLEFVDAGGGAVVIDGLVEKTGNTPGDEEIVALTTWLKKNRDQAVFATDSLAAEFPASESYKDVASGVLAIQMSGAHSHHLLWFRPEQIETVSWAGNPNKPMGASADGMRLTPRTSFALWQETVHLKSAPWLECEMAAAEELRSAILGFILQAAEIQKQLYADLKHSHAELDTFAYVASHDLKEPLRGISNYSRMLQEDCGDELSVEARERLNTIGRLTLRMDDLLNSLLEYSRLDRTQFSGVRVDLDSVMEEALGIVKAGGRHAGVELTVQSNLGEVVGDPTLLTEVFTNLISNGLKYNTRDKKRVEVGMEPASPDGTVTIYVRDNGIGIEQRHSEQIFQIFRRLHGRNEFGGGSGLGLTIVRKVMEKHGGTVWFESTPGEGTTFRFTLKAFPERAQNSDVVRPAGQSRAQLLA